jgi:hypothetical protein
MTTVNLNPSGSAVQRVVLAAATTLALSPGFDGQQFILLLQQDSTGSRVVTFPSNMVGFGAPSQTANATTIYTAVYDQNSGNWVNQGVGGGADNVATYSSAGAVTQTSSALILIAGGSATALTLALPVAGDADAGGMDGVELTFSCTTAHAHTVTTPANGINGGYDTVTFAAIGDAIILRAYNGVWYTRAGRGTNTLSEV